MIVSVIYTLQDGQNFDIGYRGMSRSYWSEKPSAVCA